jgi:CRISPR type IV-associated protein Csf2
MQIEVTVRNITPIFSAAPGSNYITIDGTINPPPGVSRFPLVRTRMMYVAADVGDGVIKSVPLQIVPGNTMRSLLRRTMLKHVIEPALVEKGNKLSIGAYATAYAGNATGNPDGVPSSFDEIATMRAHPFIGLFGGGPRMLEGRLMVDSLYPIHTNAERIIGAGYENEMMSGPITQVVWARRMDPILNLGSSEDVAVINGGAVAANGWIQDLLANSKAAASKKKKAAADEDESDGAAEENGRGLKAFNAHEVVIPGLKWVWRISLDRPTDAQVGLVLLALNKMTNERIAGGHSKDYGRFVIDGVSLNGEQVWSQSGITGGEQYFDAVAEAIDGLSSKEFEQFAQSAKEA